MSERTRMSPWTALFMGLWIVGAVAIAGATAVTLFGLSIVDTSASAVLSLADDTIDGLPELVESLPKALGDILSDRREPDYVDKLAVTVNFIADERSGGLCPALTIKNNGDEVVSLLGLRVAALGADNVPLRDWGDVVATPIPLDDGDWPGPLWPGATRHIVMSRCRALPASRAADITSAFEITELRIWQADDAKAQTVSIGQ